MIQDAQDRSYVLISPCKDEGEYIEQTLRSVSEQTIQPSLWVIVDDGSTDNSVDIIQKYMEKMPCIKLVHRPKTTGRNVGAGVIHAFNDGLAHVDLEEFSYVCKFDVDLDLPPKYFETLIERMEQDIHLGTCSGKAYYIHPETGEEKSELCGDEASVGMTKFYRTECFKQIDGFEAEVGWDGYDCHRARWFGWRALSWDGDNLKFIHLRPMGSSQKSIYRGRIRHGKGQFHIGTHPIFFLVSSIYRSLRQRPYIIGTLYSMYGFVKAYAVKERRFGDTDMIKFVRSYQMRALIHGKGNAAEWAFKQRDDILRPKDGSGTKEGE